MISGGEFLFGSGGNDAEAFRGPGWEDQGNILNQVMMGSFITPEMYAAQQQRVAELKRQVEASGGQMQQTGGMAGMPQSSQYAFMQNNPAFANYFNQGMGSYSGGDDKLRQQYEAAQRQMGIMEGAKPYFDQNRFTPGQAISGQYAPTTQMGTWLQQGNQRTYQPSIYEQDIPVNFQKATPFQFQGAQYTDPTAGMTAQQMVGDAFTPQYEMANRLAQREGIDQRRAIAEDMNRRGMLASGMTTRAMQLQQRDQGDRLSNLASQLAAGQAQQMLGANQYLQGMNWQQQQAQQGANWQKQTAQAEELFRQQGASDAQAQYLANMALQKRNMQLQAQNQAFGQQMAGRQQGVQEWTLGQQTRRQPMEDLFRLYQLSTGSTPANQGQPGLLGSALGGLASAGGAAAGMAMFCLPKGTLIATSDGSKVVEDITIGDLVVGGQVIATTQHKRGPEHRFYLHEIDGNEVVMSVGHPFIGHLTKSLVAVEHDSPCTYDILTDGGYYIVNGVQLLSTINAPYVKMPQLQ